MIRHLDTDTHGVVLHVVHDKPIRIRTFEEVKREARREQFDQAMRVVFQAIGWAGVAFGVAFLVAQLIQAVTQ